VPDHALSHAGLVDIQLCAFRRGGFLVVAIRRSIDGFLVPGMAREATRCRSAECLRNVP
jgi:hypothetical protein